jgi:hypothetical protein
MLPDQYLERESYFTEAFEEAARAAGSNPAFIYAYRKTGLIPTETNSHLMTTLDHIEWEEAIEEYETALESGVDLLEPMSRSASAAMERLATLSRDACIHFGSYLTRARHDPASKAAPILSTSPASQLMLASHQHQARHVPLMFRCA